MLKHIKIQLKKILTGGINRNEPKGARERENFNKISF